MTHPSSARLGRYIPNCPCRRCASTRLHIAPVPVPASTHALPSATSSSQPEVKTRTPIPGFWTRITAILKGGFAIIGVIAVFVAFPKDAEDLRPSIARWRELIAPGYMLAAAVKQNFGLVAHQVTPEHALPLDDSRTAILITGTYYLDGLGNFEGAFIFEAGNYRPLLHRPSAPGFSTTSATIRAGDGKYYLFYGQTQGSSSFAGPATAYYLTEARTLQAVPVDIHIDEQAKIAWRVSGNSVLLHELGAGVSRLRFSPEGISLAEGLVELEIIGLQSLVAAEDAALTLDQKPVSQLVLAVGDHLTVESSAASFSVSGPAIMLIQNPGQKQMLRATGVGSGLIEVTTSWRDPETEWALRSETKTYPVEVVASTADAGLQIKKRAQ